MPDTLPPELQSLLAYWVVRCAGRRMPDRREVSLYELDAWYDHLAIVDLAAYGDLRRYVFAFCGQALKARLGCDAMKQSLRDLGKETWKSLLTTFDRASDGGVPSVGLAEIIRGDGMMATYCDLVLPLSDGGDRAAQLLMGSYAVDGP
jgi:hypothetical protein